LQERNLVQRESCGRQRVTYSLAPHVRTMNELICALTRLSAASDQSATSGDNVS
jgi:hypothetical protein